MTNYEIATRVANVLHDYDPYEYHDLVTDDEEFICDLQERFDSGDFSITECLKDIAETAYDKETRDEAKYLLSLF